MNFVFGHPKQQSTQIKLVCPITQPTYRHTGNKSTSIMSGQLRSHQYTHNTHLGAAPHAVSHHVDKGPLVLDKRVGEEPMLVGGALSW